MNTRIGTGLFFFILLILFVAHMSSQQTLEIKPNEIQMLGKMIWKNECNGTKEGLTSWNEGEEFASLGIGHFIWYPTGQNGPFKEGFPELLSFFRQKKIVIPSCIKNSSGFPWKTREDFLQATDHRDMIELRNWLYSTVELQALFMAERLQKRFAHMLRHLSTEKQKHVSFQFYRLAGSPGGIYALVDYFNFKGAGTCKSESYHDCGWGLLHVLEEMKGKTKDQHAVQEFVTQAKKILDNRIKHAPPSRHEEKWRSGWFNRLDTYCRYAEETQKIKK